MSNGSRPVPSDLAVVVLLAVLATVVVVLGTVLPLAVRVAFVGTFLLFCPGYTVVAALFPRADHLSLTERFVFSVGASLALLALVGIGVEQTPWGVRPWSLLVAHLSLVGVAATATVYRRSRVSKSDRATPLEDLFGLASTARTDWQAVGGGNRALRVLVVFTAVTAVASVGHVAATPLPSQQFTEFYVLGPNGTVEELQTGPVPEGTPMTVGVRNNEFERRTYGIQVQTNDSGDVRVHSSKARTLDHGETWEIQTSVQPDGTSGPVRVEILLFEGDPPGEAVGRDTAYRSLQVWVGSGNATTSGTTAE